MLKVYDEFSQRQSKNNVTANNSCVHNLEPVRKIGNKIWLTSHGKMHVLTNKQTIRLRSLFYCIFFSCNEMGAYLFRCRRAKVLQIGIAEILHYKAQEVLSLKTPWIEIHLLLSNTPLHTYALVKQFLNSEKVTVLQHPSYYLVLANWSYSFLENLKCSI